MKNLHRILPVLLASFLAVSSTMGAGMSVIVQAAEDATTAADTETVQESSVTFNNTYATVGTEVSVTVAGIEGCHLVWYLDGETVSTGETYTITDADLEKFLTVEAVAEDGTVLASNGMYCSNLPVVYIDCPDVNAMHADASHNTYFDADMRIQGNDQYSKEKQLYDGKIEIKGRGSSTWWFPKKPYKIKLDKKTSLFGMGKQKHWVLMANYADESLMRNYTANNLAQSLGGSAMDSVFVDVVMNGEYVGNYQLCEQVRVDENRVNIFNYEDAAEAAADDVCAVSGITDKDVIGDMEDYMKENLGWMTTGVVTFNGMDYDVAAMYSDWDVLQEKIANVDGYLMELATDAKDEISNFSTGKSVGIACKYPEFLNTNETMMQSVKDTVQTFENALYSKTGNTTIDGIPVSYNSLCDMDSMYSYWTTCMVFMNEIGHRSNYFYIEDGKLYFSPVWDFDWSSGCNISSWPTLNYNTWWGQGEWAGTWYYEIGKNSYFAIKEQEYYWNHHDLIHSYVDADDPDSFVNQTYEYLYASGLADSAKWQDTAGYLNGFTAEYENMTTWLANRLSWMDEQFATEESAVSSLSGTVSSNLHVTAQNVDGSALEADDISVITGGAKVPAGRDIQVTAAVDNSWEASYMAIYVNNQYIDTVKAENGSATVTVPAAYLNSELGTKNVIQAYGKSSPDSDYYQCTNFLTVVQYEGGDPIVTTPTETTTTTTTTTMTITTTTEEPTTTETTTTTAQPTTTMTTTSQPTTTTTTTTTAQPTTTTTTTTAQPTTTITTTKPDAQKAVVLTDVEYGTAYDLSAYNAEDITAIGLQFTNVVPNAGGCLVLGGWSEQHPIAYSDLTDGSILFTIQNPQKQMTIYNYYGLGALENVTLYYGAETEVVTTQPTTTLATTTNTVATTKATTTEATTTTAVTTTKATTTTVAATVTTEKTTTKQTTTAEASKDQVVLTDVKYGNSYSLAAYQPSAIKKIVLQLKGDVGYGFGGKLVLGGWTVQLDYSAADLNDDNTISFEITNPQDTIQIFNYWGNMELESVTLIY